MKQHLQAYSKNQLIVPTQLFRLLGKNANQQVAIEGLSRLVFELVDEGVLCSIWVLFDTKERLLDYFIPEKNVGSFKRFMASVQKETDLSYPRLQLYFFKAECNDLGSLLTQIEEQN